MDSEQGSLLNLSLLKEHCHVRLLDIVGRYHVKPEVYKTMVFTLEAQAQGNRIIDVSDQASNTQNAQIPRIPGAYTLLGNTELATVVAPALSLLGQQSPLKS